MYHAGAFVPDVDPKPFVKAAGLRKAYLQQVVAPEDLTVHGRADLMPRLAERAVEFFYSQEWEVQWHTLTFSVRKTGMEPDGDSELWRWEAWVH
jgi:hypothetical protein